MTVAAPAPVAGDSSAKPASAKDEPSNGLSSDEARRRLEKFGPNATPDTSARAPVRGGSTIVLMKGEDHA
jgi:Cation transporter/ATPase, N-terminus